MRMNISRLLSTESFTYIHPSYGIVNAKVQTNSDRQQKFLKFKNAYLSPSHIIDTSNASSKTMSITYYGYYNGKTSVYNARLRPNGDFLVKRGIASSNSQSHLGEYLRVIHPSYGLTHVRNKGGNFNIEVIGSLEQQAKATVAFSLRVNDSGSSDSSDNSRLARIFRHGETEKKYHKKYGEEETKKFHIGLIAIPKVHEVYYGMIKKRMADIIKRELGTDEHSINLIQLGFYLLQRSSGGYIDGRSPNNAPLILYLDDNFSNFLREINRKLRDELCKINRGILRIKDYEIHEEYTQNYYLPHITVLHRDIMKEVYGNRYTHHVGQLMEERQGNTIGEFYHNLQQRTVDPVNIYYRSYKFHFPHPPPSQRISQKWRVFAATAFIVGLAIFLKTDSLLMTSFSLLVCAVALAFLINQGLNYLSEQKIKIGDFFSRFESRADSITDRIANTLSTAEDTADALTEEIRTGRMRPQAEVNTHVDFKVCSLY